jgi:hypothetical protein
MPHQRSPGPNLSPRPTHFLLPCGRMGQFPVSRHLPTARLSFSVSLHVGPESYIVFLLQSDSSIAIRFPLLVISASDNCGFLGPLSSELSPTCARGAQQTQSESR